LQTPDQWRLLISRFAEDAIGILYDFAAVFAEC
jgi:hypothetical protein